MSKPITLLLQADDAEPILRQAAFEAAKFGAFCDYFTRKTVYMPPFVTHNTYDDERKEWLTKFLAAKRIVEAFGMEVEPTSEQETLTVYVPDRVIKSHLVDIGGMKFRHIDKSIPDTKRTVPSYRKDVHTQACHAAAERVIRAWRQSLKS
jgi:hypothetical protein